MTRFLIVACICASAVAALCFAQANPKQQPPTTPPTAGQPEQLAHKLVDGLKSTPGCLGTEIAKTESGKALIFGFFEDKKAAMAWYTSDEHQKAMEKWFPNYTSEGRPMDKISEDSGPIMVIASLTPTSTKLKDSNAPVSQIAMELWSPMPGGIRINGGLAPTTMKVPGRHDLTIAQDTTPAPTPTPTPKN